MSGIAESELRRAFVATLPPGRRIEAERADELGGLIAGLVAAGGEAWPDLRVAPLAFVEHVATVLDPEAPLSSALAELRAGDLYIAFAAACGEADAIRALEQIHSPAIWAAVRRIRGAEPLEDLAQIARNHLFAGDGGRGPAIAAYGGRGSLAAWIRVSAFNIVAKAARGKRLQIEVLDSEQPQIEPHALDPELDFLKEAYRSDFKQAFSDALAALQPRQRTLLRQSVVDSLPVRRIGKMYGVHHATAARWIAEARQALVDATRTGLGRRLQVGDAELQSIIAMIRSRLDLSISRVLS